MAHLSIFSGKRIITWLEHSGSISLGIEVLIVVPLIASTVSFGATSPGVVAGAALVASATLTPETMRMVQRAVATAEVSLLTEQN